MSSSSPGSSQIRLNIPQFKDKDNFFVWWSQFTAFCSDNGCLAAISRKKQPDFPNDERVELNEKEKVAVELNKRALTHLRLASKDVGMILMVSNTVSDEHPHGVAHEAFEDLLTTCQCSKDDLKSAIDSKAELQNMKMRKHDKRKVLFDQAREIQVKHGKKRDARTQT